MNFFFPIKRWCFDKLLLQGKQANRMRCVPKEGWKWGLNEVCSKYVRNGLNDALDRSIGTWETKSVNCAVILAQCWWNDVLLNLQPFLDWRVFIFV